MGKASVHCFLKLNALLFVKIELADFWRLELGTKHHHEPIISVNLSLNLSLNPFQYNFVCNLPLPPRLPLEFLPFYPYE